MCVDPCTGGRGSFGTTKRSVERIIMTTPRTPIEIKDNTEHFKARDKDGEDHVEGATGASEGQEKSNNYTTEEINARLKVVVIQYDPVSRQIQTRPAQNVDMGFELVSILREALSQVEKNDLLMRIARQVGPVLAKQLRAEMEALVGGEK